MAFPRVCGYPNRLILPPYEDQARRLFARIEALLDQVDYSDPDWCSPMSEAIVIFAQTGDLPDDELLRDLVLADIERSALLWHKHGEDVSELMAAFDRAAMASGQEREEAVAAVQEVVRARSKTVSSEAKTTSAASAAT